ncbi:hypothetical protein [Flavobacterium psychrolimnae]|uniref:Outer membrane protein beta-barrel domain-containing protein n=1 Tax=Flavobacterium psychrolimnae TaxID=249351 RepID=A0A366AZU0_9FLAO|nr:hypothetical protein [Flavobacterium psychrolimnae]RBN49913.1 hypothetical protein DR980_10395 [Flavobacterium psychrolimnae]
MNDKKNIDRFFQERFKDFELPPNEQVWKNIQTELKKEKKERKVIPLWIKFPGIAAAFLLGLFALNSLLNNNPDGQNGIVVSPEILKNSSKITDSIVKKKSNTLEIKKELPVVENIIKTEQKDGKEFTSTNQSEIHSNKKKTQTNAVVSLQKNHPSVKQETTNTTELSTKVIIGETNNVSNQTFGKERLNDTENTKIAAIDSKKQPLNSFESPNELEEILKNKKVKDKEVVVLSSKNKWQITPNVAAVYLNSNSGGSAIDPQFSENQKTMDNSLSFGVGVNYAVSKKVTLRSGINKLSLGYNTNNVVYSTGLANNNLANINYTSTALIEIKNGSNLNMLSLFEINLQKTNTGAINQKMGYYEVPLEVSYTVLDKKFGINLIGGVSTLFLNQNKISLVSSETNITLGEARNLNQINFSTNVGVGFQYQFVKSFKINFEPMLKYQMNTFSSNSGNFKPIFVGLYSGISYSF